MLVTGGDPGGRSIGRSERVWVKVEWLTFSFYGNSLLAEAEVFITLTHSVHTRSVASVTLVFTRTLIGLRSHET